MPSVKIGGQVFGLNTQPITNATIKIIDIDSGSKNDVIFRGQTDAKGKFRGNSSNWQDRNWVNGPFGSSIDVPDVPLFHFEVTKGNEKHTGVFVPSPIIDYTSAPIICPWNNPDTLFAKVNDVFCYTPENTKAEILKNIAAKKKIVLQIFDPAARAAYMPLTMDTNILRSYVKDVLNIDVQPSVAPMVVGIDDATLGAAGTAALLILLGISAVIVSAGFVYGVALIGEGMLAAIDKGCKKASFKESTEVDNHGSNKTILEGDFDCSNT